MQLQEQVDNLKQKVNSLEGLLAEGMHDLGRARQEVSNLSKQVEEQNKSLSELIILLKGTGDDINPGLVKKFYAVETFIEWIKGKKLIAIGFVIAVSIAGAIIWFLGDAIMRYYELKKAIGK